MSVRIYELSKDIGMENADLIALLRERGYQVKSASSTVDNISAESLREEFGPKSTAPAEEPEKAAEGDEPEAPGRPSGATVLSKEDIERQRAEFEKEEAKNRPPAIPPPPVPAGKAPPPIPAGPAVTIRRPQTPPQPAINVPPSAPSLPRAPVLRTDVKEEPKPEKTAPPPPAAPVRTEKPAASAPQPMAPPRVSAPRPVAPPSLTPPAAPAPAAGEDSPDPEEAEAAEGQEDLRKLQVKTPIVVRDFAIQIGRKPFQLISELMEVGIFASMNTAIEVEVATRIARNAGYELEVRHRGEAQAAPAKEEAKPVDESELLEPRPPVVCILGHVDHGKTTLLDAIRKANVVAGEAGGITQHIGAYQIEHEGKKVSFIDTPGHAAFSNMRARGTNTTDVAVLVVAADDGFMPQTDEALGHARRAKVPVVVAINKVDSAGANVDRVMRQMQERDLSPEEWGGETLSARVSALKGEGIDDLLEMISLQAEILELKANPKASPEGIVIEAQKELGRGSTASVIVQKGTLKPGTALVCGEHYCRVRQLIDDNGKPIKSATPATPVKVVGWSGPPDAGDLFITVKNEREARRMAEANELERKKLEAAQRVDTGGATIDDLFAAIAKTQKKAFRVLVKADVYGTAEALATSLLAIKSEKIDLEVIDTGVGDVTRNDILKADAGRSAIIAFNVGQENGVAAASKHHDVPIFKHNIIYELIDQVKDAMADELEPELRENKVGAAEVRAVFPLARSFVAGCMVTEGRIQRDYSARLYRDGELMVESKISTLKRFKDDATEVRAGYECGVALQGFSDYREGDTIEVFEILKIKSSL